MSVVQFDHIGISARDAAASARCLAEILGLPAPTADGEGGDMYRLELAHDAFLLFSSATEVAPAHVAFRVDIERFAQIEWRLRERNVPIGNDPEDLGNGLTDDPLGGAARLYFVDENGHLFEVTSIG